MMKLWRISLSAHSYRPNALDFLTNFSNTDITFAAHQQLKSLPLPFWERGAKRRVSPTALWTPATFSKMPRVPSSAINSEDTWEVGSR